MTLRIERVREALTTSNQNGMYESALGLAVGGR